MNHPSDDRLSAGWLAQVLRDRGMPTPGPQEARRLVRELDAQQRREVVRALERLALGSDDAEEMELMSLAWRSVSPATVQALHRAGADLDASGALSMFRQHPAAVAAVSRALGEGPQAEAAVEELRGYAAPWQRPPDAVSDEPAGPDEGQDTGPPGRHAPSRAREALAEDADEGEDGDDRGAGRTGQTQAPQHGAGARPPAAFSAPEPRPGRPVRPQARAYSSSAAIVFELDTLRAPDEAGPRHTVSIEAAGGRGGEGYDWADKIIFQCTLRELPQVTACLMGWTRELEFRGHGVGQDKRLLMRHQGDSVYVRLLQGRRSVSLPVHRDDLYAIVLVCLRALSANDPDVPIPALLEVIRQLALARQAAG
ncbi:hypothetical protein [Caldimonas tepidiphila]|uniref:hypothetical protein n=1 Tax=Caldimonas tepidiphila TaxID=2315841 RepID=UPI000E5B88F1|nr:hypothetical protein [Caldimonas tepidiphila]